MALSSPLSRKEIRATGHLARPDNHKHTGGISIQWYTSFPRNKKGKDNTLERPSCITTKKQTKDIKKEKKKREMKRRKEEFINGPPHLQDRKAI
jgi:hypothetical protein